MYRWFAAHPEVISIFPSYKGLTVEQIKAQKLARLKEHGTNIFNSITEIAGALNDEAKLNALLEKNVKLHVPHKPNISAAVYNVRLRPYFKTILTI